MNFYETWKGVTIKSAAGLVIAAVIVAAAMPRLCGIACSFFQWAGGIFGSK